MLTTPTVQPRTNASGARPRNLGRALTITLIAAAATVSACSRPLLSPKDQRSQYDRYDKARNQYAPQYVEDEYGRKKPNLTGRLSRKE